MALVSTWTQGVACGLLLALGASLAPSAQASTFPPVDLSPSDDDSVRLVYAGGTTFVGPLFAGSYDQIYGRHLSFGVFQHVAWPIANEGLDADFLLLATGGRATIIFPWEPGGVRLGLMESIGWMRPFSMLGFQVPERYFSHGAVVAAWRPWQGKGWHVGLRGSIGPLVGWSPPGSSTPGFTFALVPSLELALGLGDSLELVAGGNNLLGLRFAL